MKLELYKQSNSIKDALSYNPDTGVFIWTGAKRNGHNGKIAGNVIHSGYRQFNYGGKKYYAHRVAWFITYGKWPKGHIDHINGNKDDNRIANLRDVDRSTNIHNSVKRKGYGLDKRRNKYRASIYKNNKCVFLGYFDTEQEARAAYVIEKNNMLPEGRKL